MVAMQYNRSRVVPLQRYTFADAQTHAQPGYECSHEKSGEF